MHKEAAQGDSSENDVCVDARLWKLLEKKEEGLRLTAGEAYPHALRTLLGKKYIFLLRGKTLMALLIRNLSSQKIQNNDKALLHSVSIRPGKFLKRLFSRVEDCFETMGLEKDLGKRRG